MTHASFFRALAATLVASLWLAACASSPEPHFYALSASLPQPQKTHANTNVAHYRVAVGPLTLPNGIDRAQLVTQSGINRVNLHENQRWSESLKTEIPRIVAQNLTVRLPNAQVAAYPQYAATYSPDITIHIDIQRFEAIPGQKTVLEALWTLQFPETKTLSEKEPFSGHTVVEEAIDTGDFEALVAAHSRALGKLSDAIANRISTLPHRFPVNKN